MFTTVAPQRALARVPHSPRFSKSSASLKSAELMALVFPESQDPGRRAGQPYTLLLPEIGSDGKSVANSESQQKARVSPHEVVRLDDTHAVMLTETVKVDDQGKPENAHVSGAWLGAYFFERSSDGWRLSARNDAVGYHGFMNSLGDLRVEHMAVRRFALLIISGSCWQGECGEWLTIYEIKADTLSQLVAGIPLSANNDGADEACRKGLKSRKPKKAQTKACYEISGEPRFATNIDANAPGELHIAFKGVRTGSAKNLRALRVDTTVIYQYLGGVYVSTKGRNPVPSL